MIEIDWKLIWFDFLEKEKKWITGHKEHNSPFVEVIMAQPKACAPRRCGVCGQTGHDKQRHQNTATATSKKQTAEEKLEQGTQNISDWDAVFEAMTLDTFKSEAEPGPQNVDEDASAAEILHLFFDPDLVDMLVEE